MCSVADTQARYFRLSDIDIVNCAMHVYGIHRVHYHYRRHYLQAE
jgi:hypothetical protein